MKADFWPWQTASPLSATVGDFRQDEVLGFGCNHSVGAPETLPNPERFACLLCTGADSPGE
jgi:hypothetical protein